ncbi:hypothetical protein [Burkholderia sp. LMG 21824]|uniref:hypothetical protein n=1 Tax=Burkholderia sp. LMG 21824 TaxID=3158172 RepID=UPI003C2DB341
MSLKIFVPLTKVDVEKRLVYGTLAAEEIDRSGEVLDYASSKPHFAAWSGDIAKATDGKSVGNLRAMHGKVAAGKFTDLQFDDEHRRIEAVAKVVDDTEWNKVLEGVYTGFSIGGKYGKTWDDQGHRRYEAIPAEGSLVDYPCIPSATFKVVKSDGSEEMRKFTGATETLQAIDQLAELLNKGDIDPREVLKLALTDLQKRDFSSDQRKKDADEHKAMPDGSFPIENKSDLENAIKAYGRAKDPEAVKKHIKARAKALGAEDMLPDDWEKMTAATTVAKAENGDGDGDDDDNGDDKSGGADGDDADDNGSAKSGTADKKGDADKTDDKDDDAAKAAAAAALEKIGARNSAADLAHLQAAHDSLVKAGAMCAGSDQHDDADDLDDDFEMAAGVDELCKAAGLELVDGKTGLEKAAQLVVSLAKAHARIKELEDMPAPTKGVLKSMNKAADMSVNDGGGNTTMDDELALAAKAQVDGDPLPMVKFIHKYGARAVRPNAPSK